MVDKIIDIFEFIFFLTFMNNGAKLGAAVIENMNISMDCGPDNGLDRGTHGIDI